MHITNKYYNYNLKIILHELMDKWSNFEPIEKRIDRILHLGKQYDAQFSFFVTAENLTNNNEYIIKKIVSSGHEIGSHSYNHISFKDIDRQAAAKQIKNSLKILNRHYTVKGFRAPYLMAGTDAEKACSDCGLLYSSSNPGGKMYKKNELWIAPVTQPMDYEIIQKEGITNKNKIGERWAELPGKGEILLFHPWRLGAKKYIGFLEKMLKKPVKFRTIQSFISNQSACCCLSFDLDFLEIRQVYWHTVKHLVRSPYFN